MRQGELEDDFFRRDKKRREHQREQQAKSVIHGIIQINIVVAGIVILVCIALRGLHLILPENWMWLNENQLNLLDSLGKYAGSGAVGSLLTRYLTKNADNGQNL